MGLSAQDVSRLPSGNGCPDGGNLYYKQRANYDLSKLVLVKGGGLMPLMRLIVYAFQTGMMVLTAAVTLAQDYRHQG